MGGKRTRAVQVPTANADLMKKTETWNRDPLLKILLSCNIWVHFRKIYSRECIESVHRPAKSISCIPSEGEKLEVGTISPAERVRYSLLVF